MAKKPRPRSWAPYRSWLKRLVPPRWDLTRSALVPCTMDDLPGALSAVDLHQRNEEGYPPLVRALATRFGVGGERITTANGATGAMFIALGALLRPGDKVIVEWPSYDPIQGAVRLLGGEVVDFSREWSNGFKPNSDDLAQLISHEVRAIVMTQPHDPSGVQMTRQELLEIGDLADAVGAKVVVDEVYADTLTGVGREPAAKLRDTFVSVNSLSKSYGLPGLRLGWLISDEITAERAQRVRDLSEGFGCVPGERMGVLAIGQMDRLLERAQQILGPNRSLLESFVAGRPELEWVPPAGGAVAFPRLSDGWDSEELAEVAYRDFGVGVVPGHLFGYRTHFRVGFGCEKEVLEGGLEALGRALDRVGG